MGANARVVESNIPSAATVQFNKQATLKQRREREDITVWLEEQEEAELELITFELLAKNHATFRRESLDR